MESYSIYTSWNQNYIIIHDWSKVNQSTLQFGKYNLCVGEKITGFGSGKSRSSFEMMPGYYLEYKGMINGWIIFDCNYSEEPPDEPHYYFAFIYVDKDTVLRQTKHGNGFADIKTAIVKFYTRKNEIV